jgi:transcriptional regulator with XRE-family HTH domain
MKGLEERLRKLSEAHGLSQIELSNELKLADLIIATYELGKKEPSLYHLTLLADYFNVSIDYLLGRDEEIYKKNLCKPL